MSGEPGSPFGVRLKRWRRERRLSQLELAGLVGSTTRHLSFLETGRSRPSRQMALRLAAALDVGPREANRLLQAAGLGPSFPETPVGDTALIPYRSAIERLLASHEPYPGLVLDGHWNVVVANAACARLFGADLVGANFVRDALADPAVAGVLINWPEVAWAGLDRLRRHRDRHPFDDVLRELTEAAERALADVPRPVADPGITVCPCFRIDGRIVRTIAMVARFDQVAEVTLDELRVELMYPLDQAAERFFRGAMDP